MGTDFSLFENYYWGINWLHFKAALILPIYFKIHHLCYFPCTQKIYKLYTSLRICYTEDMLLAVHSSFLMYCEVINNKQGELNFYFISQQNIKLNM